MFKLKYNRFADQELSINVQTNLKTTGFKEGTREMKEFKQEGQSISDLKPKFDVSNILSGLTKSITGIEQLKAVLKSVDIGNGISKVADWVNSPRIPKRKKLGSFGAKELSSREKFIATSKEQNEAAVNVLSSAMRGNIVTDPKMGLASGLQDTSGIEQAISKHKEFLQTIQTGVQENLPSYVQLLKEINEEMSKTPNEKSTSFMLPPSNTDISPNTSSLMGGLSVGAVSKSDIQAVKDYKQSMVDLRNEINGQLNQTLKDLYNNVEKAGDGAEDSKGKFEGLKNVLSKIPTGVDGLSKAFKSLDFTKLVALGYTVKRVTSAIYSTVESAAGYEESLNLYTMALGEYAQQAEKWRDTLTEKLMLDPSPFMQYMGAFYNFTKGMNVTSDAAYLMSKNLTQLTYDMASYLNISNEAAQAKIQSAMAGQSRAVASVGVAMQVASLQELAYSLGIEKTVKDMTQAEKTYLRYIQLMRSTSQMQGDLGRTMITPANAIRTLKNQIEMLGRAIGQVLTPLIMQAIPYIMAFTNVLKRAAQALASFFGYKLSDVDYSSAISFEGAEEGVNNLNAIGGAAKKAGDSVRNSLAPFDELNQVMFESSGSGSAGGGGVGGSLDDSSWDALLPSYDMLKDYTGELVDKAKDLEGVVTTIAAALGGLIIVSKVGDWFKKGADLLSAFGVEAGAIPGILGKVAGAITVVASGIAIGIGSYDLLEKAFYNITKNGGDLESMLEGIVTAGLVTEVQLAFVGLLAVINPLAAGIAGIAFVVMDAAAAFNGMMNAINDIVDQNLFGELSVSYSEWYNLLTSGSDMNALSQSLNEYDTTIKGIAKSFNESSNEVEVYGIKLQATTKLTETESEKMKLAMDNMLSQTSASIEATTSKDLLVWEKTFKGMSGLTEEEQNKIRDTIINRGAEQQTELDNAQSKINEIYDNGIKTRGYLTDEEYTALEEQLAKIRGLVEQNVTENQATLEFYKSTYTDKNKKLDEKSYSEFNKALKTYDKERNDEISRTYAEGLNLLNKTYSEDKRNTKEYQDAKKELDKERETAMAEHTKEMSGYVGIMYGDFINTYNDLYDETGAINQKTKEKLATILNDIPVDKEEFIGVMKTAGIESAEELYDNIKSTAQSPSANNAMEAASGAVKDYFAGGWHANVGALSGDMFIDLKNGLDIAKGKNDIKQAFFSIGNFVLTAIFNGLMSFAGLPGQFASKLLKEVKKALGIKSPSKLFMKAKVGDYVTQGIEYGMNREIDTGIGEVADNLLTTMQNSLDEGNELTFGDKLQDGISEITDGFKDMNDEILEFNKNANNIAINSTISANRKLTSDYSDIIGLVSGSYATNGNTATELIDNVKESVSNNTIVVQIGDEVVYKGQGEYQSRESDRYGTSYVKI